VRAADHDSLSLTGDSNIFSALHKVLTALKQEALTIPAKHNLPAFSAHCWLIGKSKLLESLATPGQIQPKLLLRFAKFGEYFRGTTRLYHAIRSPTLRVAFAKMKLVAVEPPEPRRVDLHRNWFVLETIYYCSTGRLPDVTKNQFRGGFQSVINDYGSFT
jgi:hypothetical protein